jgi:hypothetical protein|tara:strand:+ start:1214 stop:1453 length:240 start_codon:yes stop_codon:yes gene_type:complete
MLWHETNPFRRFDPAAHLITNAVAITGQFRQKLQNPQYSDVHIASKGRKIGFNLAKFPPDTGIVTNLNKLRWFPVGFLD